MALPLDPTVPLAGIALILLLVWLTGGRRQAVITSSAEAAALLAVPETGFSATRIALSQTGDVALAGDATGRLAVVFATGSCLATRMLTPDEIAAVELAHQPDGAALLTIRTTAFARPDFVLRLPAAAAEDWRQRLAEIRA